jgi:hypothetical protein
MTGQQGKGKRRNLGHTETIMVKMHPDMKAHLDVMASREYCTFAEIVRRFIIDDMRKETP